MLDVEVVIHPLVANLRMAAAKASGHLIGLLDCEPESPHSPMRREILGELTAAFNAIYAVSDNGGKSL